MRSIEVNRNHSGFNTIKEFGDNFSWGVSVAAYQIEGAHDKEGKGPSIWDVFSNKKGNIKSLHHGNQACDFYNRYSDDVSIIKNLSIPNFRFSISWPRVLPNGTGSINQKGIDFYKRKIELCLQSGIVPWVTLYHWDLPQALEQKGGWTNREVIDWFTEFTSLCVKSYGDLVNNWIVINEPMVFTGAGYFLGLHAPGRKGFKNFLPAMHHATLAMGAGGRTIRSLLTHANIGTSFSCSHIEPYKSSEKDIAAAKRVDALLNRLFIEPVLGLGYPLKDLSPLKRIEKYMQQNDEALMPFDFDFIGIQNYTREIIKHSYFTPYLHANIVSPKKRGVPSTLMNWEVYPEGIYHILKKYNAYPGIKKIIITENGAAFTDHVIDQEIKDDQRVQYIRSYLSQVLKAKREGVKVHGYFIWTLLDNFEWAEGFHPRFGIVHVDFEDQKRIIKASGKWYSGFLKGIEKID